MTHHQILADLRQKKFQPVYFLFGKEPYFIDLVSDYIENNTLTESEKSFNQVILYGRDVDHLTVIDHARRYPMMSQNQVVIVKEAQDMKSLSELAKYISNPTPTTILVICFKHKTFTKTTKFAKLLKAKSVFFESSKLYDNQVPDWVMSELKQHKLKISPSAAELIAEYLGTDLSLISHELEKLSLHVPAGTEVTLKHIEEFIGISREYNIFELQKAVATHNMEKIARIMKNFIANPRKNPFIMVIASLGSFFTKVYMLHFLKGKPDTEVQKALNLRSSYALRDYRSALRFYSKNKTEDIISLLNRYDQMAKGVNFNTVGKEDGALLKELMHNILH